MDLGERLKSLRKEQKMTQQELGSIIHVSKVSISGYENGNRSPDITTLLLIADYFEVTTDYLLGREKRTIEKKYPSDFGKELERLYYEMQGNEQITFYGELLDGVPKELLSKTLLLNLSMIKEIQHYK